jgi:hypothetical protein
VESGSTSTDDEQAFAYDEASAHDGPTYIHVEGTLSPWRLAVRPI